MGGVATAERWGGGGGGRREEEAGGRKWERGTIGSLFEGRVGWVGEREQEVGRSRRQEVGEADDREFVQMKIC